MAPCRAFVGLIYLLPIIVISGVKFKIGLKYENAQTLENARKLDPRIVHPRIKDARFIPRDSLISSQLNNKTQFASLIGFDSNHRAL